MPSQSRPHYMPYLLGTHLLQSNRQIIVKLRQKFPHTHLTSIQASCRLPSDISKLQCYPSLTLSLEHPEQKFSQCQVAEVILSTNSTSLKNSIECKKMLRLIDAEEEEDAIANGKGSKKRNRKKRMGSNDSFLNEKELKDNILAVEDKQENKMSIANDQYFCSNTEKLFSV